MAYLLRVTAGPGYDVQDHVPVPVNSAPPVRIASPLVDAELSVRIRDYVGLPRGSPASSPYFCREPHRSNGDRYSIALRFVLKRPEAESSAGVSAHDLQFGNDLDRPVLPGRLPPGIGAALSFVLRWVDPGLEGDVYAETPYLYGPALSSFNVVRVGSQDPAPDTLDEGLCFDEGAEDSEALSRRQATGAPDKAAERMRWALGAEAKDRWTWEYGRWYGVDFFNAYVDFAEFAVRLPVFRLSVLPFWDGQALRYVLRNRSTGQVYLVIQFSLVPETTLDIQADTCSDDVD